MLSETNILVLTTLKTKNSAKISDSKCENRRQMKDETDEKNFRSYTTTKWIAKSNWINFDAPSLPTRINSNKLNERYKHKTLSSEWKRIKTPIDLLGLQRCNCWIKTRQRFAQVMAFQAIRYAAMILMNDFERKSLIFTLVIYPGITDANDSIFSILLMTRFRLKNLLFSTKFI